MNIEAPLQKSFIQEHVARCENAATEGRGIAAVVGPLRAEFTQIAEQDKKAAAEMLKGAASKERKPFKALAAEAIDRNLPAVDGKPASSLPVNKALLDYVSLVSPSIRLRARAGSGKSTAIVIKCDFLINALGVAPETIQVLTFNKSAAEDLAAKMKAALGDEIGGRIGVNTFHSLAYHVLKCAPATREATLIFKDEDRSQKEQLSDLEKTVLAVTTPRDFTAYRDRFDGTSFSYMTNGDDFEGSVRDFVTGAASLMRARRGTPGNLRKNPVTNHLQRVVEAYEQRLQETGTLDGEAGLCKAAEILSSDQALPGFNRLNGALEYLFVDEYQDFSAAFEALTQGVIARNPGCVLNAVGDNWQSINAFMGADLSFFTGFKGNYAAALNLPLQTNWRCGKKIVELGNVVMKAKTGEAAVAGLPHEGRIRVKVGGINDYRRKKDEWHAEAQDFLEAQIAKMARYAWEDDSRAGREPGSLVLLAAKNKPFGRSLSAYAKAIEAPAGVKVATSTSHGSKGREWDHVILLDGIMNGYPTPFPADPIERDMIDRMEKEDEGHRLLYVAVTRAKQSLAILAPTELHARLKPALAMAGH